MDEPKTRVKNLGWVVYLLFVIWIQLATITILLGKIMDTLDKVLPK